MFTLRSSNLIKSIVNTPIRNVHIPSAAPSIVDTLRNKTRMPEVPLDQVFPATSDIIHPTSAKAGEVKMTTLPSGLRVITQDIPSAIVEAAVYVDVGSRYETPEYAGITNFLERMMLKSTTNRSAFRFAREMARTSVDVMTSSSRDCFSLQVAAPADSADIAIGTVADLIKNPAFLEGERHTEAHNYLEDVKERLKVTDTKVNELIHAAAFGGSTLGNPLYANAATIHNMTSPVLYTWYNNFFTPNRMVVSAVGVDHDVFVRTVDKLLSTKREPSPYVAELSAPSKYTGGEIRQTDAEYEGSTQVAVAFQAPSWHDQKGVATLLVLQTLLGGGTSFSTGGPGKGMCSRLHTKVLTNPYVESALAFSSIYGDNGVFGVYGSTSADYAQDLTNALTAQLLNLDSITAEELDRAKKQTVSNCLTTLEARSAMVEEMGRNVLIFGSYQLKNIVEQMKAVTAKDIQTLAGKMYKSPVTLVTYGDAAHVPRYDVIAAKFK